MCKHYVQIMEVMEVPSDQNTLFYEKQNDRTVTKIFLHFCKFAIWNFRLASLEISDSQLAIADFR